MSSVSSSYSKFQPEKMTPEKKWEEKSSAYCSKYKIEKTALTIFGLLALYGVTGLSVAAVAKADEDCPLDTDTNKNDFNDECDPVLGGLGMLFGGIASIISTAGAWTMIPKLWRSNKNITKYVDAMEVVKLRESFMSNDIEDLQKEYQSELPHFHEIGIFFNDEVYTQVCEMFIEQEEICKLEKYLEWFDENLFETRKDLGTLRSQCTERKEKLQNKWTKFKNDTLRSSMANPDLSEYYTNAVTSDSLA